MTDPQPYREGRGSEPAEGPGQTEEEAASSLPPGSDTKDELGQRGDVDRAKPYAEEAAPDRMEEQPFGSDND